MDPSLRIFGRGEILEKVRAVLIGHQWIAEPDFAQEDAVCAPRLL
jgi:hypothetical protein